MYYDVHGKKLIVPSFFQVYNFGGGAGDKSREIVYAELTQGIPALVNYYYINNEIEHSFQSPLFDNAMKFNSIGDLYNYIRKELIYKNKNIYSQYHSASIDFNNKIFLLDSGGGRIKKDLAKLSNYDVDIFQKKIISHMKRYYDFADKLKLDIVVAFDLGGRYTEKDGEKKNKELMEFENNLDHDEFNNFLLEEGTKYLAKKSEYYPYVLATVHGSTPQKYEECTEKIIELEKKYRYKYWGVALGGVASYRQLDKKWFSGITFPPKTKQLYRQLVAPAKAAIIVRKIVGDDRPIHALGCGGYQNIATNYYSGITSFDAASPSRRVGDGNNLSIRTIFSNYIDKNAKFSKYFLGGFDYNTGKLKKELPQYVSIRDVQDDITLCGCPACNIAVSIKNIKQLYSMGIRDKEANYYSRQLMGLHAVQQHMLLCKKVIETKTMEDFCKKYPSEFNKRILSIYEQIK